MKSKFRKIIRFIIFPITYIIFLPIMIWNMIMNFRKKHSKKTIAIEGSQKNKITKNNNQKKTTNKDTPTKSLPSPEVKVPHETTFDLKSTQNSKKIVQEKKMYSDKEFVNLIKIIQHKNPQHLSKIMCTELIAFMGTAENTLAIFLNKDEAVKKAKKQFENKSNFILLIPICSVGELDKQKAIQNNSDQLIGQHIYLLVLEMKSLGNNNFSAKYAKIDSMQSHIQPLQNKNEIDLLKTAAETILKEIDPACKIKFNEKKSLSWERQTDGVTCGGHTLDAIETIYTKGFLPKNPEKITHRKSPEVRERHAVLLAEIEEIGKNNNPNNAKPKTFADVVETKKRIANPELAR